MNFVVFSTPASKAGRRKNVQNRRTACFSGFFNLAILKFQ